MAGPIPTLSTDRLTLRAHRADDLAAAAAMWGDPAVTRFIGGRPAAIDEVWTRLLRYAGLWALLGHGYWAIEERGSGRFVGELGFADFRRPLDPPLDAPELGWALATAVHGRGYATEAVRAALAWADRRFARTQCIIGPDNRASLRVADKCGFAERHRTTFREQTIIVLERAAAGGSSLP